MWSPFRVYSGQTSFQTSLQVFRHVLDLQKQQDTHEYLGPPLSRSSSYVEIKEAVTGQITTPGFENGRLQYGQDWEKNNTPQSTLIDTSLDKRKGLTDLPYEDPSSTTTKHRVQAQDEAQELLLTQKQRRIEELETQVHEITTECRNLNQKFNRVVIKSYKRKVRSLIPEATIKTNYESLCLEIPTWIDETFFDHAPSPEFPYYMIQMIEEISDMVSSRQPVYECQSRVIVAWLWQKLANAIFNSDSTCTDLWATEAQAHMIREVEKSMRFDADADPHTWMCATVNALKPGTFDGNERSAQLAASLWTQLARLWHFTDEQISHNLEISFRERVIVPAIELSRQLRKSKSPMYVRYEREPILSSVQEKHVGLGQSESHATVSELSLYPALYVRVSADDHGNADIQVLVSSKSQIVKFE